MRQAATGAAVAVALVAFHLAMSMLGAGAHVSALGGMRVGSWSLAIGGLHVVAYLGALVVAPVLALASAVEATSLLACSRRASPASSFRATVTSGRSVRP